MYKIVVINEAVQELFHSSKKAKAPKGAIKITDAQGEILRNAPVLGNYIYRDKELIKLKDRPIPEPDRIVDGSNKLEEMGYFGNVWVRKLYFPTKETIHEGHEHKHDHVSLLAHGSVLVEIEGEPVTEFKAPTFITIKANKNHRIIALEDNTVWFCVFALRDENGELADHYTGDNSPYTHIED
jgi:hypothetical protein